MKLIISFLILVSIISGCHNSAKSLIDESSLVTPFPDKFILYQPEGNLFSGVKSGRSYLINDGQYELKISQVDSGFFWIQSENKKHKKGKDKNIKRFSHYAVKIKGREVFYYKPAEGKVAYTRGGMKKLVNDDTLTASSEEFLLFDLTDVKQHQEAADLLSALKKAKAKKDKGEQSVSYRSNIGGNTWKLTSKPVVDLLMRESPIDKKIIIDKSSSVHSLRLPFYKGNVELLRVRADWKPKNLFLYFLYDGSKLVRLDGTSMPIHSFNNSHKLSLDSESLAENYLWFFTFFIRGEDGPFLLFESLTDTFVPKSFSTLTQSKIQSVIRPASCKNKSGGAFACDGTVFYSNAVFHANFTIAPSGVVEMGSDQPVAADLAYKIDAPISLSKINGEFSQKIAKTTAPKPGLGAMLQTPGIEGNSRDLVQQLVNGGVVKINRTTIPLLSGITQSITERCSRVVSAADRVTLARLSVSGVSNLMFGGDYSNKDMRKSWQSQGENFALTALGIEVGKRLSCTSTAAGKVASLIACSMKANESSNVFVDSCAKAFNKTKCSCIAKIGSGVIPNLHRRSYSRSLIKEIINRNPLVGLQVAFACGVSNY